jgi:hypothetical protein
MFKPEPGQWYEMPTMFGTSVLPPLTRYKETRSIAHRFRTEPSAIEPYVPYHFTLTEPATVTIVSNMLIGVDWLAARNYTTVRVAVDVEGRDGGDVVRGPYGLVVWESDPRPVIAGREHLGISKIVGEVPDHVRTDDTAVFECYEYGNRLLRGEVTDIVPVEIDPEDQAKRGMSIVFGWKYSPGPGGIVDSDYPTKMVTRGTILSQATGVSSVTFDHPTWEQCPISARIIEHLAALPVVEVLPATVTVSVGTLDRAASARLE